MAIPALIFASAFIEISVFGSREFFLDLTTQQLSAAVFLILILIISFDMDSRGFARWGSAIFGCAVAAVPLCVSIATQRRIVPDNVEAVEVMDTFRAVLMGSLAFVFASCTLYSDSASGSNSSSDAPTLWPALRAAGARLCGTLLVNMFVRPPWPKMWPPSTSTLLRVRCLYICWLRSPSDVCVFIVRSTQSWLITAVCGLVAVSVVALGVLRSGTGLPRRPAAATATRWAHGLLFALIAVVSYAIDPPCCSPAHYVVLAAVRPCLC